MTLSEFLSRNNIEPAFFARQVGVTREGLRLWLNGDRTPRPAQMQKIFNATSGAVRPNDFLPQELKEPAQ